VNVTGTAVVKDADGNDVTAQFAVTNKAGNLKINKRTVTLTSADGEKEYDGKPLTKNEQTDITVDGDGFVDGEGATYDVTGTITLPDGREMVMPGDNLTITVELIADIALNENLRFAIREGGRTVGSGQVTKIIE
jgi:hypothetical protein